MGEKEGLSEVQRGGQLEKEAGAGAGSKRRVQKRGGGGHKGVKSGKKRWWWRTLQRGVIQLADGCECPLFLAFNQNDSLMHLIWQFLLQTLRFESKRTDHDARVCSATREIPDGKTPLDRLPAFAIKVASGYHRSCPTRRLPPSLSFALPALPSSLPRAKFPLSAFPGLPSPSFSLSLPLPHPTLSSSQIFSLLSSLHEHRSLPLPTSTLIVQGNNSDAPPMTCPLELRLLSFNSDRSLVNSVYSDGLSLSLSEAELERERERERRSRGEVPFAERWRRHWDGGEEVGREAEEASREGGECREGERERGGEGEGEGGRLWGEVRGVAERVGGVERRMRECVRELTRVLDEGKERGRERKRERRDERGEAKGRGEGEEREGEGSREVYSDGHVEGEEVEGCLRELRAALGEVLVAKVYRPTRLIRDVRYWHRL
eukprot:1633927-Rhodomonas_salina.1